MPYIAIKAYPKDEKTKKEIVEKINQLFVETGGCPQEAINIAMEEVDPADWEEKVAKPDIQANPEKMMMVDGKKTY